jgi:hypothetical protein
MSAGRLPSDDGACLVRGSAQQSILHTRFGPPIFRWEIPTISHFTEVHPTLDNYWRAVILFGRNVASYEFALGKALLQFAETGKSVVPLTDLAHPIA